MRTTTLIRITTPDTPNPKKVILIAIEKLMQMLQGKADKYPISISHVEGDRPDYVADLVIVDRAETDLAFSKPDYSRPGLWMRQTALTLQAQQAEAVINCGIADTNLRHHLFTALSAWRDRERRILDEADRVLTWQDEQAAKKAPLPPDIQEALNSGDGTYKP